MVGTGGVCGAGGAECDWRMVRCGQRLPAGRGRARDRPEARRGGEAGPRELSFSV